MNCENCSQLSRAQIEIRYSIDISVCKVIFAFFFPIIRAFKCDPECLTEFQKPGYLGRDCPFGPIQLLQ